MIRPHLDITAFDRYYWRKVYPPLQWNEVTSHRKMISDLLTWLHNHYPLWSYAMVYFTHSKDGKSYTEAIKITRGQKI